MRVFKIKAFAKWASGEGLSDDALASAVVEMEKGLIDAKLGRATRRSSFMDLRSNESR